MVVLGNSRGLMTILSVFFLPMIFLALSILIFSSLQIRRNVNFSSMCQREAVTYLEQIKSELNIVDKMNTLASSLYHLQNSLLPFIVIPQVAKLYQKLLKLRHRLHKMQSQTLASFNQFNSSLRAVIYARMITENWKVNNKDRKLIVTESKSVQNINPQLQIRKKINTIFPPYALKANFSSQQIFQVEINNQETANGFLKWLPQIKSLKDQSCLGQIVGEFGSFRIRLLKTG